MTYADFAATTPCLPAAVAAVVAALDSGLGNPGSRQHEPGRRALAVLDHARAAVATLLHARPDEIIFTSGATEALNLGIVGCATRLLGTRPRFVTWQTEHAAVLAPYTALSKAGATVAFGAVDAAGAYALPSCDEHTALVSAMLVNNETGVIQDIPRIAATAHTAGALLCCDATAALGRVPLDVTALGADFVAISGHKCYAPPGIGVLWVRRGLALEPQIHGGGQERGLRSGTPNVPGLAGLAVAAEIAHRELAARQAHLLELTTTLEGFLRTALPRLVIHGHHRAPGTTMMSLPGLPRGWLSQLVRVDASGGSACSTGQGSHVLLAMGVAPEQASNAIRLSLGITTTLADVATIAHEVIASARRLQDQC